MSTIHSTVLEPRQLNDTDEEVLDFLTEKGGRVTRAWVADETENSRPYVSQRLKRLKEHGHVMQPYRGLWELVDDPRQAGTEEESD